MANEELHQRNLIQDGEVKGTVFGKYEDINIGATNIKTLLIAGLKSSVSEDIAFPFMAYKTPKNPLLAKPDRIFVLRKADGPTCIAVAEHKAPKKLKGSDRLLLTSEQGLYSAIALGANIAIATDGTKDFYIDVKSSINEGKIKYYNEHRSLNPAVLDDLLAGEIITRDPSELAERVWQHIWHATKDEPKQCLLTFVELFVLKFLSDNLPDKYLPKNYKFYELLCDNSDFVNKHGRTQIEYYIETIRPKIKMVFPDNTVCDDSSISQLFGLGTVVSKTSIINGFSFLKSSTVSPSSYNKVFMDILREFDKFGSLTSIDPEFKLRLYETFLKKSAKQAKLGQFFTPRNVVQAIIKMADVSNLPNGSVVLDPAAGVGGFVLEPTLASLQNNVEFKSGKPIQNIKFIGIDVDAHTHILAKANTLIHYAEAMRNPSVTPEALNKLMARMFLLMNDNETLGSLERPPINSVDLIMTNPPYVTQGSRIYKESITDTSGSRNGVNLGEYYDSCGLGLESLFLRYISGALKPGGKAFVIVPQGMLTRTETGTKNAVLSECNLIASIALPKNTFFNTPQKTYIIVIEKRHTEFDDRPSVFCGIAKSIGESLDYRRYPTPEDNVLDSIASEFSAWSKGTLPDSKYVRIVSAEEFTENDRWDVLRFWEDEELVEIGEREPAQDRQQFIEEVEGQLSEILDEFAGAKKELTELSEFDGDEVLIGNEEFFKVRRGKRVRRMDCDLNPGNIPVYSGSKNPRRPLGYISPEWLEKSDIPIEENPIVTVNANGYVGAVFVRVEKCVIHDDVMIIEIIHPSIDHEFLAYQLQGAIAEGNFEYEAKLYGRVKDLAIKLPRHTDDTFDINIQKKIAAATKRLNNARQRLTEVANWSNQSRLKGTF
ncbi:N-6 DNA methylase [Enterobacter ludwigii]|uniref:N-6 DNA methylase n=1 Tax=Enterobacter ludwigii TaxID=299767 RepID=UPI0009A183EB|nr:N-6 DNA methylase [Enterobacter ludwigii]RTN60424.1 hypothetical protein EKN82_11275 [Enterobacter ludwigii]